MSTLAFRVTADYEELIKLQQEIEKTKRAIGDLDVSQAKDKFDQLNTKLGSLSNQYEKLATNAAKNGAAIEMSAMSITKALSAIGGVAALKELGGKIIQVRGQFQQMDTAIQTMLGNKQQADQLLTQVKKFAQVSPLELSQVISATQMMLGFNIEAEKVPRYLQAIGDVSMGDATKFSSLTLAFSQMSASGKLMGQDLNQMINAGFNPLSIISQKTGKSIGQLKDEMGKGAITSQMVQQAFIEATSAGGKFFNMSQNAAKTIPGQISMLNDALDNMFNTIGQGNESFILNSISGLTSLVNNYDQVGKVLVSLVASYGLYRTAVIVATAAENGHSLATLIMRERVLLAQKAQELLNATMLNNPYVIAAVALGALITTLVATSSSISDAEAAQNMLNDTTKEAEDSQKKYNEETQSAINIASSDASATDDRRNSMNLLIKRYPSIIKKYIDEEGHLKNILNLKREIASIDGNKAVQGHIKKSNEYTNISNTLHNVGEKSLNGGKITDQEKAIQEKAIKDYAKAKGEPVWRVKAFTSMKTIRAFYDNLSKQEKVQASKTQTSNRVDAFSDTFGKMSSRRLQTLVKTLQNGKNTGKKSVKLNYKELGGAYLSQDDIGTLLTKATGIQNSRKEARTYKQDSENAKKEYATAKKNYESLKKSATATTKQVQKARRDMDAKSKAYKDITGSTPESEEKSARKSANKASKKKDSEAKKVADALAKTEKAEENSTEIRTKQQLDAQRSIKDMQFETEQATIDALKEGSEKKLKQLDLNKRKELDKIDRDYEDIRQKKVDAAKKLWDANPQNKGKNFYESDSYKTASSSGGYTDEENANRSAKIDKVNSDYEKGKKDVQRTDLESINTYLKAYGDMQEKRLAIAKEYDDKIAQAQTEGDRMQMQAGKDKALSDFDVSNKKSDMNWEDMFGNLNTLTKAQLESVKSKLRNLLSSNDLDVQGYKSAVEQIDKINESILTAEDKEHSFLGVAVTYGETRRKLEMDVADALQRQADLTMQMAGAQANVGLNQFKLGQDLDSIGVSYNKGDLKSSNASPILQKVGDKYGVGSDKYVKVQKELEALAKSEREYNNVVEKKKKSDQDASNKQSKLNKYLDDFAAKLSDLMPLFSQINDNLQDLPGLLQTVGVSEDSSIGKSASAMASAGNSAMSAMQDYMTGNYIGAAMNGMKAIGSAVQSATNLFAGAGNEKAMEAEIERLSKANESLSTAIDNLADKISDSDNTNSQSVDAYKKAVEDEEEWESNQRQAINDRASEYTNSGYGFLGMGGKGSFNKHAQGSDWSGWSDFNKVLESVGSKARVNSISDFWKLSPEDMKELQTSANAAWRALFDNDGYKSPEDLVKEYIDRAGKLEDLTDSLNEKLTGYSWSDFKSSFEDILKDMGSDFDDFSDNINEELSNAVLSSVMNDEFKDKLKKIYDTIAEFSKDGNLDEDEIKKIKDMNAELAEEMLKRRAELESAGLVSGSSSSQSATANAVSNISNDQASDLIGRVTASQIAIERGNSQRESIVSSILVASNGITALAVVQAAQRDIADETRTFLANIYLEVREQNEHLGKIEGAVSDIKEKVRKIEMNTQD